MSRKVTMEKLTALAKNRGYIYPGSEIYGGLANTWDYGPLGVEFKNNIKKAWWKKFVQESKYNVGLDAAILMNPQTWVASGHVGGFADPLIDCKSCKSRFRADQLIEGWLKEQGMEDITVDGWSNDKLAVIHRGKRHQMPRMRQVRLHRYPPVQSHVQDFPGRYGGFQSRRFSSDRKLLREYSSTSKTCRELQERRSRSV